MAGEEVQFFCFNFSAFLSKQKLFRMSTGCHKTIFQYVNMSICPYVNMSTCQYVNMSICQNATFQLSYQNESCSECQNDIRKHHIGMSTCQYVSMSICLYVNMLICQNATFQPRYQNESCSKCHIVLNVIRMSECQYVRMPLFSLGIKIARMLDFYGYC